MVVELYFQRCLASIIHKPDLAVRIVRSSGFPPRLIPTFDNADQFWETIVQETLKGTHAGGIQSIIEQALDVYPHNKVLLELLRMSKRLPSLIQFEDHEQHEVDPIHFHQEPEKPRRGLSLSIAVRIILPVALLGLSSGFVYQRHLDAQAIGDPESSAATPPSEPAEPGREAELEPSRADSAAAGAPAEPFGSQPGPAGGSPSPTRAPGSEQSPEQAVPSAPDDRAGALASPDPANAPRTGPADGAHPVTDDERADETSAALPAQPSTTGNTTRSASNPRRPKATSKQGVVVPKTEIVKGVAHGIRVACADSLARGALWMIEFNIDEDWHASAIDISGLPSKTHRRPDGTSCIEDGVRQSLAKLRTEGGHAPRHVKITLE